MKRQYGYWTKERCVESAKECKTQAEFRRKYPTAFHKSWKEGFLKEYTWFEDGNTIRNKKRKVDSYEKCKKAALKCKTMKEFIEKYPNETAVAYRSGWVSEYTWLEREKKPNGYWNYEHCLEAAKSCKTLREFSKKYTRAYTLASKEGWLKEYTWLVYGKTPYKDNCESVYAYFFKANGVSAVYVGLTVNPQRRDNEHRNENNDTTVFKYHKENGIEIPKMTVLESNLSMDDAKIKEDYYKNKYNDDGWQVLNIGATGLFSSSLGQIGRRWTYEKCYEKALLCKTQAEFDRRFRGACASAKENGWMKDYTWFIKLTNWTYEKCYEKAQLCSSRGEFESKYPQAYTRARKQKWLDDYTWFSEPKTVKKWDYKSCYAAALECKSKMDFNNKYIGAYNVANKNKWLKDYTWFERPKNWNAIWDYESCKQEAMKYSSRGEFQKKSKKAYMHCYHHNYLDDFFPKAA